MSSIESDFTRYMLPFAFDGCVYTLNRFCVFLLLLLLFLFFFANVARTKIKRSLSSKLLQGVGYTESII